MGRRWATALVGVLALGGLGPPASAPAQDRAEVARARQVLEYYQTCQRTRRFVPCWGLLSRSVQDAWARQGRGTATDYGEAKGAGAIRYSDFRVLQIRRSPARVVFVVEATRSGETSPPRERVEYALLRERGQWRIDGLRVAQSENTP